MILIDTSVFIDFLKGNENVKTKKFESIIKNDIPYGISIYTFMEILQGIKNDKQYQLLKEYLETQNIFYLKNKLKSYEYASQIYRKCRKKGITIRSTIDILIVQTAIDNNLALLHNDKDFTKIGSVIEELKILTVPEEGHN